MGEIGVRRELTLRKELCKAILKSIVTHPGEIKEKMNNRTLLM